MVIFVIRFHYSWHICIHMQCDNAVLKYLLFCLAKCIPMLLYIYSPSPTSSECVCVCVYIYKYKRYIAVELTLYLPLLRTLLCIYFCWYTGPPEYDLFHAGYTLVHPNMSHIVYMLVHGIMTCHMLFYALVCINMTCPVLFAHRSTLTKPVPFRFDALVHLNMICTMLCIQWLPPEHDLLHASM